MIQGMENAGNMSMVAVHGQETPPATARQTQPSGCHNCVQPPAGSCPDGAARVKYIARVYGAESRADRLLACWPLEEPKLDAACATARSRVEQLIEALPEDARYYHFVIRIHYVLEYTPDGRPARMCQLAEMLRTQSGRWMERKGI